MKGLLLIGSSLQLFLVLKSAFPQLRVQVSSIRIAIPQLLYMGLGSYLFKDGMLILADGALDLNNYHLVHGHVGGGE